MPNLEQHITKAVKKRGLRVCTSWVLKQQQGIVYEGYVSTKTKTKESCKRGMHMYQDNSVKSIEAVKEKLKTATREKHQKCDEKQKQRNWRERGEEEEEGRKNGRRGWPSWKEREERVIKEWGRNDGGEEIRDRT